MPSIVSWQLQALLCFLASLATLRCCGAQLGKEVSLELKDWECRHVNGIIDWNGLREIAVENVDFESVTVMSEMSHISVGMRMPDLRALAFQECPLGTIFLSSLSLGVCLFKNAHDITECTDVAEFVMESMFMLDIPLAVLLTSAWPLRSPQKMVFLYERGAHGTSEVWHSIQYDPILNCQGDDFWEGFLKDLNIAIDEGEPLVKNLTNYIQHPLISEWEWQQLTTNDFQPSCFLGWIAMLILKAAMGWHTEPRTYFTYAEVLRPYLAALSPWHFLGSSWFLSLLLPHVCQYHRTVFDLDFHQAELMQDLKPEISALSLGSEALKAVARAVLSGGAEPYWLKEEQRLLAYATYVWGEEYVRWLPAFIQRFQEIGVSNLIIFCGDEAAYSTCLQVEESTCVLLTSRTGLHRYTIPLVLLNLGVDAFVIDFDIYPFKNITAKLISELESYEEDAEFLVGGSFGDACICNAFAFYKNTPNMREFTRILLAWLYQYPFPHGITQKALSAFLGEDPLQKSDGSQPWLVKKEILVKKLPPRPQLKWSLFEPGVEFSSSRKLATSGWAGKQEDIVVYHFFHGGWLASESPSDPNDAWDEFDIFYNFTCDQVPKTCSTRREERIRQLLEKSRVGDSRPYTNLSCQTLEVLDYTVMVPVAQPG